MGTKIPKHIHSFLGLNLEIIVRLFFFFNIHFTTKLYIKKLC